MKIIILIIVLVTTLFSQNTWEFRTIVRGNIDKFKVVDSNNIYCISDKGLPNYLDKSTDGGLNWFLVNDLTKYDVYIAKDIEVVDSLIFISFSGDGIILKSTDNGETFEKIQLDIKEGLPDNIDDIIMFDANNGIANMPLRLYKTTDSWKTFDTIPFSYVHYSYNVRKLDAENFISQFAIYSSDMYESSDLYIQKYDILEDTYIKLPTPVRKKVFNQFYIYNDSTYYFAGKINSIKGGSGRDAILKSTDAGKTWRTLLDLYTDKSKGVIPYINPFGLQDIAFKNDSVGIAVGQFGKILYTYDGGESWFYEQQLPELIDAKNPPTMLITYAGDRAIIGDFSGAIHTLKEDNLAPKPEDTLTISGKIHSEDSLAITCIPIRLNNNRITMTDEAGNYKFTKLAKGTYTVAALNKYIDSGPKKEYHYEPYLYSPTYTLELTSDTTGIDFNAIKDELTLSYSGSVMNGEEGVSNILLQVNLLLDGKIIGDGIDTLKTDKDGKYYSTSRKKREYIIRPMTPGYIYSPKYHKFVLNSDTSGFIFQVSPITSVSDTPNFEIKSNVLYSKDIAGMNYKIISITGVIIVEGNLKKELDLNPYPNGTYILNIVKGEEIIFTHKFQVVK